MEEKNKTDVKQEKQKRYTNSGFMLKEYLGYDMEQQLYALRDKLRDEERAKRGASRGRKKTHQDVKKEQ